VDAAAAVNHIRLAQTCHLAEATQLGDGRRLIGKLFANIARICNVFTALRGFSMLGSLNVASPKYTSCSF
jgi:hypothetical protein